jgi:hypothetical protein
VTFVKVEVSAVARLANKARPVRAGSKRILLLSTKRLDAGVNFDKREPMNCGY